MVHKLEVTSVIKEYNNHQILTDVYLTCLTGEVVGLLGRNGTGKSTLLQIIFGTLDAVSQNISIDGKQIDHPYLKGNLIAYGPKQVSST